jgi:catechol 2,3-dioxygenase-like lactoylglutathione lyase family enzyme
MAKFKKIKKAIKTGYICINMLDITNNSSPNKLTDIISHRKIKDKMTQKISHISIVVDDYDKAIEFYTKKLNFVLLEDTLTGENKRWVKVAPNNLSEFSLLLAKAANEIQKSRIGNQTGGRVFLFLNTNDFENDYQNLLNNKIKIIREPTTESYGKVLVFEDCYGNLWDLIEPIEKEN